MKNINKSISKLFFISLALSIGFPAGIVGIVFGAIKSVPFLLVLGIVLTVAGFYVMPITWVKYAERRQHKSLLFMIENENILTVSELANQTSYEPKKVREMINFLIMKNYLVGYLFHDDILEENTNKKEYAKHNMKKCPNCGAVMQHDGEKFVCEYCSSYIKK